jgi:hypothetical protein
MSTNADAGQKPIDSRTDSNHPAAIGDDEIVAAVAALAGAGETDVAGGVPPAAVADELGCAVSTARDRLPELAAAGTLVRVWGFETVGAQPRRSYLPAETPTPHAGGGSDE